MRREEGKSGTVRWLRPTYQAGKTGGATQAGVTLDQADTAEPPAFAASEQQRRLRLRTTLAAAPGTAATTATRFARAPRARRRVSPVMFRAMWRER